MAKYQRESRRTGVHKLTIERVVQYIYIYGLVAIILLPICNVFFTSFKTQAEIVRMNPLPGTVFLDNIKYVLNSKLFYQGIWNSVKIIVGSLCLSTVLAAMASYPLARNKGKIWNIIYFYFLSAQMIPAVANMIPTYQLLKKLNLINTHLGMILLYSAGITMGVLLFTSFIKTIPMELVEAAEIDGCSYFKSFFVIVLPMLKPVCITYMTIRALNIWNDFLSPQLYLTSRAKQTFTLGVYTLQQYEGESMWGPIFAWMALGSLIPIVFFCINQKTFLENMSIGALKS